MASEQASYFDVLGIATPCLLKPRINLSRVNNLQSSVNGSRACVQALIKEFDAAADIGSKHERMEYTKKKMDELTCLIPCDKCREQEHNPWTCKVFKQCDAYEKWTYMFKCQLCTRCLEFGHFATSCPSTERCKKKGCGSIHHTLLHAFTIQWDTNLEEIHLDAAKLIVKKAREFRQEAHEIGEIRFCLLYTSPSPRD